MSDSAAERRALTRRRIYLRGRLPDIAMERGRLRDEIRDALGALKTATDPAESRLRRFRISYLRQRAPVLAEEWAALAAERKTLVAKLRERRPAKAEGT